MQNSTPGSGSPVNSTASETQPEEMLICFSSSASGVEISPLSLLKQQQLKETLPAALCLKFNRAVVAAGWINENRTRHQGLISASGI